MKPLKLTIDNIACVGHLELDLTNTMLLICGEVRQGKTTALNAIKYLSSGKFPDNLIKNGETEAAIRIDYVEGFIERTYYRKNGVIKARPLKVELNGEKVSKPADFVKKIAGEYVMNQDHFNNMTPDEKKQYFLDVLNVDTSEEDRKIEEAKEKAKALRAEVKAIGKVDATPVEKPVPVTSLLKKRKEIETENEALISDFYEKKQKFIDIQKENTKVIAEREVKENRLAELRAMSKKIREEGEALKAELEQPLPDGVITEDIKEPTTKSTAEIDEAISRAAEAEEAYKKYQEALAAEETIKKAKAEVSKLEKEQKAIAEAKKAKLVELNDTHGIEGLLFGENGEITFLGNTLDTLSTSEQMELSNKIIALQGNDLGIVLLDRAESLGANVFDFIERAKRDNLTILATYVGERPANVPEEVGVYMMQNGVANGGEQPEIVAETNAIVEHEEVIKEEPGQQNDPVEFNFDEWKKIVSKVKPVLVTELLVGTLEFADTRNITISYAPKHKFQCQDLNKPENLQWLTESMQLFTNTEASLVFYVKEEEKVEEPVVEEAVEIEDQGEINFDEFDF